VKNLIFLVLLILPRLALAQDIYVADFGTEEAAIKSLMPGVTDVFRSAIAGNSAASLTTRRDRAAYIVTGTVTRFGELNAPPAEQQPFAMSGSANIAVQLFSFAVQSGNKSRDRQNAGSKEKPPEPEVLVYAQLEDVKTGRIVAASSIHCASWREYLEKGAALAADFVGRMPLAGILGGSWRGALEGSAGEDEYILTFRANNQCTITLNSRDAWGETKTQKASGNYGYSGEILTLHVNFRDQVIPHVPKVDWRAIPVFANDRSSFSAVIPVTAERNAPGERVTVRKE
jgi:hypothetical protein